MGRDVGDVVWRGGWGRGRCGRGMLKVWGRDVEGAGEKCGGYGSVERDMGV